MEPRSFSIVCDSCFAEITEATYIQCCDCTFDLCLMCVLEQVETPVHSKHHRYRVVSEMGVDMYNDGWSLLEEMLFIEGLEVCGIGNWADICNYVGREKDVEDHFYRLFGIGRDPDAGEAVDERVSNPHRGPVSSYMPHRRDFDVEYMNDQETLIRDMEVSAGDDEIKRRFMGAVLKSYMNVVRFRERRRYVILDRNLVDLDVLREKDAKAVGIIEDIKCAAPYLTKSDFNVLFSGLYIEHRLEMLLKRYVDTADSRIHVDRLMLADKLLSRQESAVCGAWRMAPGAYLELKKEVVSYLARKQELSRHRFKKLLSVLDQRADEIYGFFQTQGWIYKDTDSQV